MTAMNKRKQIQPYGDIDTSSFWHHAMIHNPKLYQSHLKEQTVKTLHTSNFSDPDLDELMKDYQLPDQALAKNNLSKELKILGVELAASALEIKRAYRKMARLNHPDRGGSEKKMKAINDAYQKLLAIYK
jgi:DnaJ-domain-containing protein 1